MSTLTRTCMIDPRLQCKARERLTHSYNLTLHGAAETSANDRIDLEITPQPEHKAMLSTALHIVIDETIPRPPAGIQTRRPEPLHRKPKPDTFHPKLETRNSEPDTRNLIPGTRNPIPETRNQTPETRT